ncbi:MAG: type IV pilus modification protein PilV [Halioglobus sp.]
MKKRTQNYATKRQAGVGLIEVLIAMLIFTVGLLGLTTMQLGAKRSNFEATQRSVATSLARDILARMRSNPEVLSSYVVAELGDSAVAAGTDCNAASCTELQLAGRDLYEWSELLQGASEKITIGGTTSNAGGLVDYRACITNTLGLVSVAISWKGVNDMANPTGSTCGEASGVYGAGQEKRRLLVMTSYIGAS